MSKVTVSAIQMRCTEDINENIKNAEKLVREAAAKGANIILLPELFERLYFCQERRYEYYTFAKSVDENDAVKHFCAVAKELDIVLPISFYEKDKNKKEKKASKKTYSSCCDNYFNFNQSFTYLCSDT